MPTHPSILPIIRSLADCYIPISPSTLSHNNESTTLEIYQKQRASPYLKNVVHFIMEPLELFREIIIQCELSIEVASPHSVGQLRWQLWIKEAHRSVCFVQDALGVLHQGYFQSKQLLEHVNMLLYANDSRDGFCPRRKLTEHDVQKLSKLKENLQKLNKFLDLILLHHSSVGWDSLPPLPEIERAAKKIFKAINHLTPAKLKNLTPFSITEEDVLCAVLGLNDDLASSLRNLDKEIRQHRTDMYFLLCFIKERDESGNVVDLRDRAAIECALQKMGFTENRSNVVAKWISEQPLPEEKSLLAWAEIYIENLFKYDIFLNNFVPRFQCHEEILNIWSGVEVNRGNGQDEAAATIVPIINTTTENEADAHIRNRIAEFKEINPNGNLYFHGTDHVSAKIILEDGINLNEGKGNCDFSHGKGFYVANDFDYALNYACTKTPGHAAVILFSFSEENMRKFRRLDLSGHDKQDDLATVTKFFKSGERMRNRPPLRLYNDIGNSHCLSGPIRGEGTRWRDVTQTCIKKEELANEFGQPWHIVGIVFLSTENARDA